MKHLKKYNEEIDWAFHEEEFEEYNYDLTVVKFYRTSDLFILQEYINNDNIIIFKDESYKHGFDKFKYLTEHEIENIENKLIWVYNIHNDDGKLSNIFTKYKITDDKWCRIPYTELKKHFNIKFN